MALRPPPLKVFPASSPLLHPCRISPRSWFPRRISFRPLSSSPPTHSKPLKYWERRMKAYDDYKGWPQDRLIERIQELETWVAETNAAKARAEAAEQKSKASSVASGSNPPRIQHPNGNHVPTTSATSSAPRKNKPVRVFDVSQLPIRKIAIRFAYDGANYSGLAAHGDGKPEDPIEPRGLPTVEAVLWNAMCVARLVDPAKGRSGAGWSRCGRTDSGVSAAGQVVSLWVRSNKVDERHIRKVIEDRLNAKVASGGWRYTPGGTSDDEDELGAGLSSALEEQSLEDEASAASSSSSTLLPGKTTEDEEINYVVNLNRELPDSIRILSWSPVRPSFNARFDCVYRHYKFFFTSGPPDHLLPPANHPSRRLCQPRMDIEAMREAASYLVGDHDFQNLCRVDPKKLITNFRRRVDDVSIDRVESGWPMPGQSKQRGARFVSEVESGPSRTTEEMYVLNLRGTAFLYHQVRHIMTILFLVGAGIERPAIVKELLNLRAGAWEEDLELLHKSGTVSEETIATLRAGEEPTTVFDTKPEYDLSADRPLVLWECGYRPKDVSWRTGPRDEFYSSTSVPAPAPTAPTLQEPNCNPHTLASTAIFAPPYKVWIQRSISLEISRHFLLSASTPAGDGTYPSRTTFESSRFPQLHTSDPAAYRSAEEVISDPSIAAGSPPPKIRLPTTLPFGNGQFRSCAEWSGLRRAKREDTPEVKNERWRVKKASKDAAKNK